MLHLSLLKPNVLVGHAISLSKVLSVQIQSQLNQEIEQDHQDLPWLAIPCHQEIQRAIWRIPRAIPLIPEMIWRILRISGQLPLLALQDTS